MEWCTCIELGVLLYIVVLLVRLVLADCDLTLQWAQKFGKSTDVLARKVVWITGASGGIGEHLAYELARARCRLILSARRDQELERVKKQCLSYGTLMDEDVLVLPLDMLNFDLHKPAMDEVLARYKQIDILVNNAGRSQRAWWVDTELAVDREMLELNVLSVLSLTKLVLPHMLDRKSGHIVNMSSVAGKIGAPCSGSYVGTKHAIQGWFDGLRMEVFPSGVSVTNLCPGPVVSGLGPNMFSEKQGVAPRPIQSGDKKMSTARCARLCAVAIANKLPEAWITRHPVLFFMYARQYMPSIFTWLSCRIGLKQAMLAREGQR